MRTWWHYGGGQTTRPYLIAVTRTETNREALEVFGEPFPSPCVHELTARRVLELAEVCALQPGDLAMVYVDKLPVSGDPWDETPYR